MLVCLHALLIVRLSPVVQFLFALFSIDILYFLSVLVYLHALLMTRLSLQPYTVSVCSFLNRYSYFLSVLVCLHALLITRLSLQPYTVSVCSFLNRYSYFLSVLVYLHALLMTRLSPAAPVQPRVPLLTSQHSPPKEWIESLNANCRKCLFQYNWKRYENYLHHRFTIPCPSCYTQVPIRKYCYLIRYCSLA